jgi:hypothetical protein
MISSIVTLGLLVLNVALSPNRAFTLHGLVVDDSGRPLSGVKVEGEVWYDPSWIHLPIPFTGSSRPAPVLTTTDNAGKFSISTRGTYFTVYFHMDGWHPAPEATSRPYRFSIDGGVRKTNPDSPVVYVMLKGNGLKPK